EHHRSGQNQHACQHARQYGFEGRALRPFIVLPVVVPCCWRCRISRAAAAECARRAFRRIIARKRRCRDWLYWLRPGDFYLLRLTAFVGWALPGFLAVFAIGLKRSV